MIAKISGKLEELSDTAALIDLGNGLWYEVFVPACDAERLRRHRGKEIIFHTIHYLEGDPSHGAQTPRLIGFLTEDDRAFFRLFTTVKGIGIRKALKAMLLPMGEIAAAIAAKNPKPLTALPGIGKRAAETIIAELHGKVDAFATGTSAETPETSELPEAAAEAISVLVQLGERRADAAALVERVLAVAPELTEPESIIQQVYKLKTGTR
jgi:Holliday junction DNA helicase RuvA